MNPNRTYEENMAALKKVLTQRTYTALSHRNVEFVLKYQNASLQELAAYLRRRQAELRHIPGRTEIIGGDFIELRFRGWVNALEAIGVSRELAAKRSTPALEKTALFQAEFNTQRELDKAAKAEAKKQNKAKEKPQIQGKGRRFRADLLLDEKISYEEAQYVTGFCNNASPMFLLEYIGVYCMGLTKPWVVLVVVYGTAILNAFLFCGKRCLPVIKTGKMW